MMLTHLLLLLALVCKIKIAAADIGFPRYLSFRQYRNILSFADDKNIKLLETPALWDDILEDALNVGLKNAQQTKRATTAQVHTDFTLSPIVLCHIEESDMCGVDRFNAINMILSKGLGFPKYFLNPVPLYNNNNFHKKDSEGKENEEFHGTCFMSSLESTHAKQIDEKNLLVTPVAPLLKIRKQFFHTTEDEDSIDETTRSLAVMLAPGIFSSETKDAFEFAHLLQKLQNMDNKSSFLSTCDKNVIQKASVSVGSIGMSLYFFYEFHSQFSYRCHKLFIEYIVGYPQVLSVEKVAKTTVLNHQARFIVESGDFEDRPWFNILTGKGQVVQVSDTGLDEEHCYLKDESGEKVMRTTDFDLTPLGKKIDTSKRKVIQYVVLSGIGDDIDSSTHGTHVVASIVGKRSDADDNGEEPLANGIAPEATISFFDGNNKKTGSSGELKGVTVPEDISQMFYFGRQAGASITSASWGSGSAGEYTIKSQEIDKYFYEDYDDRFAMFAAAGNDGENTESDENRVGYPCVSKNIVCVGASYNSKDLVNVVASFSSRGFTADGRIKPDVVAPGRAVLSALANTGGACDPDGGRPVYDHNNRDEPHDGLIYKSGTSMACPIAAGSGALVRQYFLDGYYPSGSEVAENSIDITGTLLKAVMINGAEALTKRSKSFDVETLDDEDDFDDSEYYDEYQGYGKINLLKSLKHPDSELESPNLYVENERILQQDWIHDYTFPNVCNAREFRVTLVWRDPPNSSSGCNHCLINNLNLEVELKGQTYHPNGRNGPDDKNNVERVILDQSVLSDTLETVLVRVKATDLGYTESDVQKYSLVSTGCFDNTEVEFDGPGPDPMCDGENEFEYTVELFTDRKPEETNWILKKQGSDEIITAATQGKYRAEIDRLKTFRETGCIAYGCYLFIMKDRDFNGLCCTKGMGSYVIKAGDEILIESDSFGDKQEIGKFCYPDENVSEATDADTVVCNANEYKYQIDIKTDLYPDETRWELRKARIDGVDPGYYATDYDYDYDYNYDYNYDYDYDHDFYFHEGYLDCGGCYLMSLYYVTGYKLLADDVVVVEEYGHASYAEKEFCYSDLSLRASSSLYIDGQFKYQLHIIPGQYYQEKTWWEFYHVPIDSVPFMMYSKQFTSYSHTGCSKIGECYEFRIIDKRPDGLCCYFGSGSYKLSVDGDVLVQGDHFDDNAYLVGHIKNADHAFNRHEFCYNRPPSESNSPTASNIPTLNPTEMKCGISEFEYRILVRTDFHPNDISWSLENKNIGDIIESVDWNEYFLENYEYNHLGCLSLNECYEFKIWDSHGDGLCCNFGNGRYTIFADDIVMAEGEKFDYNETKTFCYGLSYSQSPSTESTTQPTSRPITADICENGSSDWHCGYWSSIGACEYSGSQEWMLENCANACANCCIDHSDYCYGFASDGLCTDTDYFYYLDITWQEWMHWSCRVSCGTCGLDFTPSTTPQVICSDDEFKYEIVVTDGDDDYEYDYFRWSLYYTYPDLVDQYEMPEGYNLYNYGIIDSFEGSIPPNYEKRSHGCAKFSCFDLYVFLGYLKIYDVDAGTLIAQNTEMAERLRFCHVPLEDVIFTIKLEFSRSPSDTTEEEYIQELIQKSILKILFQAQEDDETLVTKIDYRPGENEFTCEIIVEVCRGRCEGETPNFRAFVANTMNENLASGELLSTIEIVADSMNVDIFDESTKILSIDFDFKYESWPTTSPTTLPTLDCDQNLFGVITSLFQPLTKYYDDDIPDDAVICPGLSPEDYCDCRDDCFDNPEYCSCADAISCCEDTQDYDDDMSDDDDLSDDAVTCPGTTGHCDCSGDCFDYPEYCSCADAISCCGGVDEVFPTEPPTSTPTQDHDDDMPFIIQTLFGVITSLLQPITQTVTQGINNTIPDSLISNVLLGVESYNSTAITCTDRMFFLHLEIQTDDSPNRTSWELLYQNGTTIDSVGRNTYTKRDRDTTHHYGYCVEPNCYLFNLFDSFEFKGSYSILIGDTLLAQENSFRWWTNSKRFCYPTCEEDGMFLLETELTTDSWPKETFWQLAFDNETVIDHVDKKYYTEANRLYYHRHCLPDGCYDLTFHDYLGDGMCCNFGEGSYTIKINGKTMIEGGEFSQNKTESFCHPVCEDCEGSTSLIDTITNALSGLQD